MTTGTLPHLFAVTRPLAPVPDLFSYADPFTPLLWTRGDRGCIGIGETLRLEFSGEHRFTEAAEAWRRIAARSEVKNDVSLPGAGLIAFGTFAFDDRSEAQSVLVVPHLVISRHDGQAFLTEISTQPITSQPTLPAPREVGNWQGTELATRATDEAYLAGVRGATALIEQGQIEKVVMSRRVQAAFDASDDLRVPLSRLAERYTDCWTYAVDGMIGASPETLIRQIDGVITARVLAGTRGRKTDAAADEREREELLANKKEHHEHAFAVQSVVTALSPHVQHLETSESPFALKLPNVWHLATDLRAVPADGGSSLELTGALQPTAAVAGTPTSAAIQAIHHLEPFDRERYAGATGWIDAHGDGEWVIALRGAQVREAEAGKRAVTAYAGGGIVAGSDPAHEMRETVSKFRPIAEALAP